MIPRLRLIEHKSEAIGAIATRLIIGAWAAIDLCGPVKQTTNRRTNELNRIV